MAATTTKQTEAVLGTVRPVHNVCQQSEKAVPTTDSGANIETDQIALETETETETDQSDIVDFDDENDPQNPINWRKGYKWLLVVLMSGTSLAVNITTLVYAPATPQILAEFNVTNNLYSTLILCIWNLGSTFGCLLAGPLSEIFGRMPVYNIGNACFVLVLIGEAESNNIATVIALRCLNGLVNTSMTLNPSIVGDMFGVHEQGLAQSVLSLMPLLGIVLGPIAGGWIAQLRGWRWTFWFAACFVAGNAFLFLLAYRETYEAVLLRRKAERLRKQTQNMRLRSRYDDSISARAIIQKALVRPLKILLLPVFLVPAFVGNLLYGYVYLIATSMTEVFEQTYHFSEGAIGLSFLGLAVGMALGSLFCSIMLDRYTKAMQKKHNGTILPEWRLPPLLIGVIISPMGLLLYGWTAQYRLNYVIPIVGTALCGFAAYTAQIPVTTYLIDTFGVYRGAAMAAMTMSRNAMSTVLPLAAPALYQATGPGWGNSVLAFIALAMLPVTPLMMKYGERMRKRSKLDSWS